MMRQLLLISLLLFPVITFAGGSSPWCLVSDEIENCRYSTADQCYNAVAEIGGSCRENARLLGMRGTKRWCVVSATGRKCNFGSQGSCLNAARQMDAGCVENTEKALATTRDAEYWGGGGSSEEDGGFTGELEAAGVAGAPDQMVEQVVR